MGRVSNMIHIISLGAGVQSTTMALMAAAGEIEPMPLCAIFADTQSEPKAVYSHLKWLETVLPFPVYRVTAGSLCEEILAAMNGRKNRMDARPPFFVQGGGVLLRQCTQDYKLIPIHRKIRELAGVKPRSHGPKQPIVAQWIGLTVDEASRMKPSRVRWIVNKWPLIDRNFHRGTCKRWLSSHGFPIPVKSACVFCPYHGDAEWARLKREAPQDFETAVRVDHAIRPGIPSPTHRGTKWYLHRSMRSLDIVEFRERDDTPSLFGDECQGLCGV